MVVQSDNFSQTSLCEAPLSENLYTGPKNALYYIPHTHYVLHY